MLPSLARDGCTDELISLLSSGGDGRITLDPQTGLNKYFSAPYPRQTLAYASSTANDLSVDAFAHLRAVRAQGERPYSEHLADLRTRIRAAYEISEDIEIVFAPSGTDLEYIALAAVLGKGKGGIHNVLLGADEVGSGCIHSAHGRYFAAETALGIATCKGELIGGFGFVELADIPVRCSEGQARCSETMTDRIAIEIERAVSQEMHSLIHVVHGSKTGLILPEPDELDALASRFGDQVSFVVDACQARITISALHDYLKRGAMVFLTGSKFMGGPPFNGFVLVPRATVLAANKLPSGLANVFRRAEFPENWAGRDCLPDGENPGLGLRYEASIFELERFQRIPITTVSKVLDGFEVAIEREIVGPTGARLVLPFADGEQDELREHPIEMRTLATLDVSMLRESPTFEAAQALHKRLAHEGLRLGQPVKCVRKDGDWGGTLRIGLSMPQITKLAALESDVASAQLDQDMRRIAEALRAA